MSGRDLARFRRSSRHVALAAALSLGLHLLGITGLALLVGRLRGGDAERAGSDTIDVDTMEDGSALETPPPALVGPPRPATGVAEGAAAIPDVVEPPPLDQPHGEPEAREVPAPTPHVVVKPRPRPKRAPPPPRLAAAPTPEPAPKIAAASSTAPVPPTPPPPKVESRATPPDAGPHIAAVLAPPPTPPPPVPDAGAPTQRTSVAPPQAAAGLAVGSGDGTSEVTTGAATGPGGAERAAFLALLRDTLKAEWRAKEVYYRLDRKGALEVPVLVTLLQVRILRDGTVRSADVSKSSGLQALDAEALRAIQRAQPLPRPPPALLDREGGFSVPVSFQLQLGVFRFAIQLKQALLAQWQPSMFFRRAGDRPRSTIARLMLTRQGVLVHATVLTSAGYTYLDDTAMDALKPGIHLPAPPAVFAQRPGLVPIFVEFVHNVGDPGNVHVVELGDEPGQ